MDATKALKQIYLFRNLTDAEIKVLAQIAEERVVDAGETLVTEGQKGDAMYVIHSGTVKVFKDAADVVMLGTGSHFGEISLADDAPRSASVVANERTELLAFSIEKLRAKIDGDKAIAASLYKALARSLAGRLRQATDDLGFARQIAKERRS